SSRKKTSRWPEDGAPGLAIVAAPRGEAAALGAGRRPAVIDEPARSTPVWGEYDVVVLGRGTARRGDAAAGGPAGLAAATAAARRGAHVLLVERYGFLGGMGTAAGVTNFCGLHANVHGTHPRVIRGVADELLERPPGL